MYQYIKLKSEFNQNCFNGSIWNDAVQLVVLSTILKSSKSDGGNIITEFESEPTVAEITALNNLRLTIDWDGINRQIIYNNFKQLSGGLIEVSDTEVKIKQTITVKEKEIFVKGTNMQDGTINFINSKKAIIIFQETFIKIPRVQLTLMNTSVTNPYATNISKTGFTVNFQNNWNGIIEWVAIERS